jgi:hypothetical protein
MRMSSRQYAAVRRSKLSRTREKEGEDNAREAERVAAAFGFREDLEVPKHEDVRVPMEVR